MNNMSNNMFDDFTKLMRVLTRIEEPYDYGMVNNNDDNTDAYRLNKLETMNCNSVCENINSCVLKCWDGECMANPPCGIGQRCVRACQDDNKMCVELLNESNQCCSGGHCHCSSGDDDMDNKLYMEYDILSNKDNSRPYKLQLSRSDLSKEELKLVLNVIQHMLDL